MRVALRDASSCFTSHRFTAVDLGLFRGVLCLFGFCLVPCFLTTSRSHQSYECYALNDRLSCHGAHGMGKNKKPLSLPSLSCQQFVSVRRFSAGSYSGLAAYLEARHGRIRSCFLQVHLWVEELPFDDILEQFVTLKAGILRGVFRQKAAAAWFGCRAEKAQVTVLLPGELDATSWLEKIDSMSHSWPKRGTIGKFQVEELHAKTFHLHGKFTRARHMWLSLRPDWNLLRFHMYADWPGIYSYAQLNDRLFINPGHNDTINDTPSSAGYYSPAYHDWQQQGLHMAYYLGNEPCRVTMRQATLMKFEEDWAKGQQEVEEQTESRGQAKQIKRWRTKQGVVQLKATEPTGQAEPITVDPNYAEVLRDVTYGWMKRTICWRRTHDRGLRVCIGRFHVSPSHLF